MDNKVSKSGKIVGVIIVALLIILAFSMSKSRLEVGSVEDETENEADVVAKDGVMLNGGIAVVDDVSVQDSEEFIANEGSGSYELYTSERLAMVGTGRVVLFFHAPWCPTCKALDTDINASLSDIPERVTILKTDYDSNTALKQKYGVTYQHTLVEVDSDGNMINKWSGGNTLESIIENL